MLVPQRGDTRPVTPQPSSSLSRFAPLFALAILAPAQPAAAWTDYGDVWQTSPTYQINPAGSADIAGDSEIEAVEAAFTRWTKVACTTLRAQRVAWVSSSGALNSYDANNRVSWVEEDWSLPENVLAMTFNYYTDEGIVGSDMLLNGEGHSWTTDSAEADAEKGPYDVETVVLHEAGHFYGLDHTADEEAVMFANYKDVARSLGSGDIEGICALYPTTTALYPVGAACAGDAACDSGLCRWFGDERYCTADCGVDLSACPTDFICTGAPEAYLCQKYPQLPDLCTPCDSSAQCDNSACVEYGGANVCLTACTEGCKRGYNCNSDTGYCEPNSGSCKPNFQGQQNQACYANGACVDADYYCIHTAGFTTAYCLQKCDKDADCPSGHACASQSSDGGNLNYCVRTAKRGELCFPEVCGQGDVCGTATDEPALLRCRQLCDSASDCASNHICYDDPDSDQDFCLPKQPTASLGDSCAGPADCDTKICAVFGDTARCTQACNSASDCGAGYVCKSRLCGKEAWYGSSSGGDSSFCSCDRSSACEDGCGCDPDCASSSGCGAVGLRGRGMPTLGLWIFGLFLAIRRRRR